MSSGSEATRRCPVGRGPVEVKAEGTAECPACRKLSETDRRTHRIVEVVGVEDINTLYGGPFEGNREECPHCGEKTAKDPCVHCNRPIQIEYANKEPQEATQEEMKPDWTRTCEVCGATPVVPLTGMCGPCTFGDASTAGGNW